VPRPNAYPPDLRDRLILAAAERLAEDGPQTLSLRELAASQETSTNAIYSIFGGKAQLIAAVVDAARASFVAAQQEALGEGDSLQTLAALGTAYRAWALAHPSMYRVMFSCDPHLDFERPRLENMIPLRGTLARLIEEGAVQDAEVAPVARSLWAAVHGWVMLEIADGAAPGPGQDAAFGEHLRRAFLGLASDELRSRYA
jgi:AcrR family transcriptional regulator